MVHRTKRSISKLRNSRGQELHLEAFTPEGPIQAVLVFHHGYGEHVGRYQEGELYVLTQREPIWAGPRVPLGYCIQAVSHGHTLAWHGI